MTKTVAPRSFYYFVSPFPDSDLVVTGFFFAYYYCGKDILKGLIEIFITYLVIACLNFNIRYNIIKMNIIEYNNNTHTHV
jgi:hypothetical protein